MSLAQAASKTKDGFEQIRLFVRGLAAARMQLMAGSPTAPSSEGVSPCEACLTADVAASWVYHFANEQLLTDHEIRNEILSGWRIVRREEKGTALDAVNSINKLIARLLDLPQPPNMQMPKPGSSGEGSYSTFTEWTIPQEGTGIIRDFRVIVEASGYQDKFKAWWDQRYAKEPEDVNAHPALVRALTATRRVRQFRHPDGDTLDLAALPELGARIPDPMPFSKTLNQSVEPHLLVLIDQSGSMRGRNMKYANMAATMIAKSALLARCPFDIVPYEIPAHIDAAISWRPGKAYPKLPVAYEHRGHNDMLGATLHAAGHFFAKKPVRKTRRIIISICDGDISYTAYVRGHLHHEGMRTVGKVRHQTINGLSASMREACEDLRNLPITYEAEPHGMAIGYNEEWMTQSMIDPEFKRIMDAFSSFHCVPQIEDLPKAMSVLASKILQPATR